MFICHQESKMPSLLFRMTANYISSFSLLAVVSSIHSSGVNSLVHVLLQGWLVVTVVTKVLQIHSGS